MWDTKEVATIADILEKTVVLPEDHIHAVPLGLKLHLTDIMLEELAKIGRDDINEKALIIILKPHIKVSYWNY